MHKSRLFYDNLRCFKSYWEYHTVLYHSFAQEEKTAHITCQKHCFDETAVPLGIQARLLTNVARLASKNVRVRARPRLVSALFLGDSLGLPPLNSSLLSGLGNVVDTSSLRFCLRLWYSQSRTSFFERLSLRLVCVSPPSCSLCLTQSGRRLLIRPLRARLIASNTEQSVFTT
jgi:hypothetical protein